jgi:hypothetical protein
MSRMVNAASARGGTAWSYHCLAPQTWSVPDSVRTDLQTLRLAIANATAAIGPCTPRKSQHVSHPPTPYGEKRASLEGALEGAF